VLWRTDSEALFLAILGSVVNDPVAATERVVALVAEMVNEVQQPLRFTAALSNGRDLYAFRYSANDAANTLYFRKSAHEILAVSEPRYRTMPHWSRSTEKSSLKEFSALRLSAA
jgi:glutamine amidotransferase